MGCDITALLTVLFAVAPTKLMVPRRLHTSIIAANCGQIIPPKAAIIGLACDAAAVAMLHLSSSVVAHDGARYRRCPV